MSTTRKTRADSTLGTLPEERQAQIAEHARAHTLEETCAWLKEDGVKCGRTALSLWLSSYVLRAQFRLADHDTLQFIALLRTRRPDLPESELQQWGAEFFQMQAVKAGDSETFLAFATARTKAELERKKFEQRERQLQLDIDKFQFNAAEQARKHAAEIKLISASSKLSESEKINAIRQRLFGALPEETRSAERGAGNL